jgi:hypothetical protein
MRRAVFRQRRSSRMQLPLSFEVEPSNETNEVEPILKVWASLDAKRKSEALALVVHLLAKATTATESTPQRKGLHDE